ncbi:MAG TPA: potassium channel family protein [Alphaproteobacteria bacterium]|jgi:voltage-gated potassium channel|nr:potassium channel family protein [Alphaproteobacteria bacterium]
MQRARRNLVVAIGLTAALVLLIDAAAVPVFSYYLVVNFLIVVGGVIVLLYVFPHSHFFALAVTNLIGVYTCIFIFFVEVNFSAVTRPLLAVGYLMPIIAFYVGAWWRRQQIEDIVTADHLRDVRHIGRIFLWLVPVFAIGALTFFLPALEVPSDWADAAFVAAMAAISIIVIAVCRDVSTFLIDTSLLFDQFFTRMARLIVPAVAFLTFYSMLVIVFASIYRVIDVYSTVPQFLINGRPRVITFSESLYFSITTLSTVGYGDVAPEGNLIRVIVAIQIVCGVLLLLFGFSEIISYARERRREPHD